MRVLLAWVICCLTGGLMAQSDPELLVSDSLAQLAETYPDDSLVRKSALLHRAGLFAIDAGKAPRAIDLTERARKLRLRGGDKLRADLVRSTYNLGTYHQELAEYRAALEYFDRVLALAPNDKEGVAHYQSARVYARRGAFAAGETAFRRAATLPPFAGDDYSLGILKMNWGGLHLDKQNRTGGEQALPLLNAALDHFAVYDDTDYERMLCLNRLGLAHTEAGQYESALATLLEAESLATELEADDEDHNVILTNLGLTYRRLDQSTIALRYYRQGLTRELREGDKAPPNKAVAVFYNNISTAHLHEGRPDSALHYAQLALEWNPADPLGQLTYLQDKARALHATGDATTALATFRRADELLDRMRRDQLLEDTRNYWRADARKLYGEALTVAVAADDPQAAFYFMEKARARLLLDELSADRARTALPATIRERLTAAGREATNSPTALRRYRRLQDSVLNAFPDYARESVGAPPPTPDQLNDLLGDGALVQYFVDEAGSVALTWTSAAGLQLTELAPLANWQDQLAAFRQAITDPDRAFTDDAARQLYDVLIRPLHLPPGQKLTIVPDGPLYQLPFGALLTDVPQPESDYDRWPWLASMRQISYAFSTQLLAFARVQRGRGNGRTLALAPVARLKNTDRLDAQLELPATLRTLRHLAELLPADTLVNQTANRDTFRAVADAYSLLHLGTHAYLEDKTAAGFLLRDEDRDRYTTDDLREHNFRADLVVIGACETGLGAQLVGEGVASLGRAFARRGAPSLIMSLWSIDDATTADLLNGTYDGLATGAGPASALNAAGTAYREAVTNPRFGHPYYWAGLVAYGPDKGLTFATNTGLGRWWLLGVPILMFLLVRRWRR